MAWTINHLGGAGPGIDMSGFAQNAFNRNLYAAQAPSFASALGGGIGQGINRGVELAIEEMMKQRADERSNARADKREAAYLDRIDLQQQRMLERQIAVEQEQAFQKQYVDSSEANLQYLTENPSPDPMFRIEHENIVNDAAALQYDPNSQRLPAEEKALRMRQLQERTIALRQRIPQRPPPEVEMLQSTISGQKLNETYSSQIVGAGGGVGMPAPFDPSATYYPEIRNGAKRYVMLEGTGAEYQAKVDATRAKAEKDARGDAPPSPPKTLGEWAMTGHPQATMMLTNGLADPRTVATINPKTGMFDIQEGDRLPSPIEVQQEQQDKVQKYAEDKAARVMAWWQKLRSSIPSDPDKMDDFVAMYGPADRDSLKAKAIEFVQEEDRLRAQFAQEAATGQPVDPRKAGAPVVRAVVTLPDGRKAYAEGTKEELDAEYPGWTRAE